MAEPITRVYLAGPMRGIPKFNFPEFNEAADYLRSRGYIVFNPAEKDIEAYGLKLIEENPQGDPVVAERVHGFSLRKALALDLAFICNHAQAIALLPGWENSKGANAEKATADALGLHIIYLTKLNGRGYYEY